MICHETLQLPLQHTTFDAIDDRVVGLLLICRCLLWSADICFRYYKIDNVTSEQLLFCVEPIPTSGDPEYFNEHKAYQDNMATQEQVQTALEAAIALAVSVKLPPFWPDKTDIWFAQAEAQFKMKNITNEKTKYAYVVSVQDSDKATQVLDIIRAPPAEEPYKALKNRLTVWVTKHLHSA